MLLFVKIDVRDKCKWNGTLNQEKLYYFKATKHNQEEEKPMIQNQNNNAQFLNIPTKQWNVFLLQYLWWI